MAEKKLKKLSKKAKATRTGSSSRTAKSIMESANQIWLAGLGAFAKAQEEGNKIFETLVKEGQDLEAKTRKTTTSAVKEARDVMEETVSEVQHRATDSWDKLEKIFEDRVAQALGALGVPTAKDVQTLTRRVEELQRAVDAYSRKAAGRGPTAVKAAPAKKAAPRKTAARKAAAKKAVSRKTATKKAAPRKTATKKAASRKTATKKTASRKTAAKKAASRKKSTRKVSKKK